MASPTTIGAHKRFTRPSGQAGSSCTYRGPVASGLSAWLYNASDQIVFAAVFLQAASNLGTALLPETRALCLSRPVDRNRARGSGYSPFPDPVLRAAEDATAVGV